MAINDESFCVNDGANDILAPPKRKYRERITGVKVINKETGESKVFACVGDAVKYTGIGESIIRAALKDPLHHSHFKSSYENTYSTRNGVIVPRVRKKYIKWDFQPYSKYIVACYEVYGNDDVMPFVTHEACRAYLGISSSTYYDRVNNTELRTFGKPVKSKVLDKEYFIVTFGEPTENIPTRQELLAHYSIGVDKNDSDDEVRLSELPPIDMSGDAAVDNARLEALKVLGSDVESSEGNESAIDEAVVSDADEEPELEEINNNEEVIDSDRRELIVGQDVMSGELGDESGEEVEDDDIW